jgi:hypothetical protein
VGGGGGRGGPLGGGGGAAWLFSSERAAKNYSKVKVPLPFHSKPIL